MSNEVTGHSIVFVAKNAEAKKSIEEYIASWVTADEKIGRATDDIIRDIERFDHQFSKLMKVMDNNKMGEKFASEVRTIASGLKTLDDKLEQSGQMTMDYANKLAVRMQAISKLTEEISRRTTSSKEVPLHPNQDPFISQRMPTAQGAWEQHKRDLQEESRRAEEAHWDKEIRIQHSREAHANKMRGLAQQDFQETGLRQPRGYGEYDKTGTNDQMRAHYQRQEHEYSSDQLRGRTNQSRDVQGRIRYEQMEANKRRSEAEADADWEAERARHSVNRRRLEAERNIPDRGIRQDRIATGDYSDTRGELARLGDHYREQEEADQRKREEAGAERRMRAERFSEQDMENKSRRLSGLSSYSEYSRESIPDLLDRKKDVTKALADPTLDKNSKQYRDLKETLKDIDALITQLNTRELNVRTGTSTQGRMKVLEEDLKHLTDPGAKLRAERELADLKRHSTLQIGKERLQDMLESGRIDENEYHRRSRKLQNRFDSENDLIAARRNEEDWAEGRKDPTTGFSTGKQNGKGTQGNKRGDRQSAYNIHQLAFAADDAMQVYENTGFAGAARAASNNLTAVLSNSIANPMLSALAVVGTSLATVLLPKLFASKTEAEGLKTSLEHVNDELKRLKSNSDIRISVSLENSSLDPDKIKAGIVNRRHEREKLKGNLAEVDKMNEHSNLFGEKDPETGEWRKHGEYTWGDAVNLFMSDADMAVHQHATAGVNFFREPFGYDSVKGRSPADMGVDYKAQLKRKRAHEARGLYDKGQAATQADRERLAELERQDASDNQFLHLAERKDEYERDFSISQRRNRAGVFGDDPVTVRENATARRDAERVKYEETQATFRDAGIEAGGNAADLTDTYNKAMKKFDDSWKEWIEGRVDQSLADLTSVKEAEGSYDRSSNSNVWGKRGVSVNRRVVEWESAGLTDKDEAKRIAETNGKIQREEYEKVQARIRDDAIAANPENADRIKENYRKRMKEFDEGLEDWINSRMDAAREAQRAENPTLDKSLRKWFAEKEGQDARNDAFLGNADLNDPTLRMHEQEQEYWMKVKKDKESLRDQKSEYRRKFSPDRAGEEDYKKKAEDIDKMDISAYDKLLLKEAAATEGAESIRSRNTVKNVNSAVESNSLRSAELQQAAVNANNPIVTRLDREIQILEGMRRALDTANGRSTPPIYQI